MSALLKAPELTKYELIEEIGHGGMATVFRARDRRLGREVAVKIIHRHLRDNSEVAERFAREATAVAKLRHTNIVEVFDVSDPEERERYLVVELIRGVTLRERLRAQGPLPPEAAAALALEIGAGLEHAHRQSVIHRDVKPENVLIELTRADDSADERLPPRIKLADFGIAKLLDAQGVTSTGQVLGSPAHMAPEQIDGGEVDARTDVFGLGVLIYESMAGRLPFQGEHPAQVLRKVLDGDFVPAERVDPKIGASYSRLIARALARDREERFASVQELMDALRQELASLGFTKLSPLLDILRHPDPQFEDEVVARLIERGTRARAEGRVALAAECFGRALAYRPSDRQLLRRVSGLERSRKLKSIGVWVVLASLVATAGVFAYRWNAASAPAGPEAKAPPSPGTALPQTQLPGGAPGPGTGTTNPAVDSKAKLAQGESPRLKPAVVRRPPPAAEVTEPLVREVMVRITGAMGGTLKIDGQPMPWFGDVRHSLTIGPHQFEFTAPDSTCCQSSSRTVMVVPGEGAQQVIGEISFLDATLRVNAQPGDLGFLECPTLFPGDLRFPGARSVAMSRVRVSGICTLRSDEPGSLPKKAEVTLRAGQTTAIPWP